MSLPRRASSYELAPPRKGVTEHVIHALAAWIELGAALINLAVASTVRRP
jgi:hypothetical protein